MKKIFDHRTRKSGFQKLEDCLQLDGFGEKILSKFYDSILGNKMKRIERRMASVVTPKLPDEVRSRTECVVALNVGVNSISWTRIGIESESQFQVTDWEYEPIDNKKYQLLELVQIALQMSRRIPEADVYLMENPAWGGASMMGNANANKINVNVERSQMVAIFSAMLMNRNQFAELDENLSNVYFVKQFAAARLFNCYVGNEKISNIAVLMNLMGDDPATGWMDILSDLNIKQLNVPDVVRAKFHEFGRMEKESMGNALLVGLTFIKLGLFTGR